MKYVKLCANTYLITLFRTSVICIESSSDDENFTDDVTIVEPKTVKLEVFEAER